MNKSLFNTTQSEISPVLVGSTTALAVGIITILLYRFEDIRSMSDSWIINIILILFATMVGAIIGILYEKFM
jgi:hypothetical protein